MSEQVPEATNENEVQMLHAEMDAHCKIADLCFAAGAETDDGTSVGAVRGLVKLLAQAQASLAAARAQALEEAAHRVESIKYKFPVLGGPQCVLDNAARVIRKSVTPSDSTALAKLLAEERLAELKLHQEKHACDIDGVFHIESKCLECRFYVARIAELKGEQP